MESLFHSTRKPSPRARLSLEALEDRAVPATYTVTTLQDELNPTDGLLSLREAVMLADGAGGNNTIVFQTGLQGALQLTLPAAQGGGVLNVTAGLSINGTAAPNLTIQQTVAGQSIFNIAAPAGSTSTNAFSVNISNLTLSGTSGAPAIQNTGENLTLFGDEIDNNSSATGAGVTSDTSKAGTLTIQSSTIALNQATGTGGGLSINGPATIQDSTIANNTAGTNGGGIDVAANGNVIVRNSTIAYNSVTSFGGGGGMRITSGATVTLQSTLVANNTGGDVNGGPSTTQSANNFIGSPIGLTGLQNGVNGNLIATQQDPRLGALTYNAGGTTRTIALLQGSPAIGTGSNAGGLTTDQNGRPRSNNGVTDIGAVAFQGSSNGGGTGGTGSGGTGSGGTPGQAASPATALLQQIIFFALSQPAGGVQILGLVDFNNDGVLDIVLSLGRGRNQTLLVLDGTSGAPLFFLPAPGR